MASSTLPFIPFPILSNPYHQPNPSQTTIQFSPYSNHNNKFTILKMNNKRLNNNNCSTNLSVSCYPTVAVSRLERLVSEFESLTEPIDRVKRLLDYAARLPPFDESARSPGNRVTGCTTQVWLEVRIDEKGRVRFRGDSDSEITKGFISCLISLLDGLEPDEVVSVKAEDLAAMNVGIYGKAQSRINTWNNVLINMHNRTLALVAEQKRNPPLAFTNANASFPQSQLLMTEKMDLEVEWLNYVICC
ncbi:sufE-like protein 2, chloroplastic isoform X2 [Ricinus communis]|uniref:sufE-like protein 2, chloroplastic isoform X2 n=1 Tax=Ricinus communis TaxID=3988 RepID=UPI00201B0A2B|nr:sufE-like protein 2, chloroplastic isoform X2 [Ricinus communis]XP_048233401.1 sufE-like protein 2, chloroplastic isoform X2 [Ricinus communis]